MKRGWASLPVGSDPGTFIASGGSQTAKPTHAEVAPQPTLGDLFDRYLSDIPEGHKEKTTLGTEKTHMGHFRVTVHEVA